MECRYLENHYFPKGINMKRFHKSPICEYRFLFNRLREYRLYERSAEDRHLNLKQYKYVLWEIKTDENGIERGNLLDLFKTIKDAETYLYYEHGVY